LQFTDAFEEINNVSLKFADFKMKQRWSDERIKDFVSGAQPIEPAQLFARIKTLFNTYIELPDQRLYDFLTLWSIGTYFHPLFNSYPYVYAGGISGTGKTKLLTLCSLICFNSVSSGAPSTASLFRLIQSTRCSIFLDESDALSNRYSAGDIRNLLLCGYKKGEPVIRTRRTDEGGFDPEFFEVYSPKMLVNIEGLETVLGTRCIEVIMQRGSNRVITSREVVFDYPIWQQIRDMIYLFLMKNWKAVKQAYAELQNDDGLQNRDWEKWKPILSLAQFFGTALFQSIRTLAIEKAAESQFTASEFNDIVLAETLLAIVDHDGFYKLADVKYEMDRHQEDNHYLSSRQIGILLRKLGFLKTRRVGSGYQYYLQVSRVETIARNLGISEHSERCECLENQGIQTVHNCEEVVEVA
jgi:hypothetical protein